VPNTALPAFSVEAVRFRGTGPHAPSYEGRLHAPAGGGPWPGVVVCHAHPHRGGSMDGLVLETLADICAARGIIALRFNFRGVGGSTGTSTADDHELDDVHAALDFLALHPLLAEHALALAGYSFGSWAALRTAEREPQRVRACVGIGHAALPGYDWLPTYPGPKCFIHGARDQVVPLARFEEFYAIVPEPKERHVISADHFFIGAHGEVADIAAEFLRRVLQG
jgi:alpha/beta superfamily hydrolase